MAVNTKYITTTQATEDPLAAKNKVVLSDDAFAICEMLENLVNVMRNK